MQPILLTSLLSCSTFYRNGEASRSSGGRIKSITSITARVLGMLLVLGQPSIVHACDCGDDYCTDTSRYQSILKEKKSRLKTSGYPSETLGLLDRADHCYAAISMAPDGFSIMTVSKTGDILVIKWAKDDVRIANEALSHGELSNYFVFNVREAFACCGGVKAEERSDWDPELSLSRSEAIECTWKGSLNCR